MGIVVRSTTIPLVWLLLKPHKRGTEDNFLFGDLLDCYDDHCCDGCYYCWYSKDWLGPDEVF